MSEMQPTKAVSAIVEFLRLTDMCCVTGMERDMAEQIKAILTQNPHSNESLHRHPDTNTYCLTSEHINSVRELPKGHIMRSLCAKAMAEGYMRSDVPKFLKGAYRDPQHKAHTMGSFIAVPVTSPPIIHDLHTCINTPSVHVSILAFY